MIACANFNVSSFYNRWNSTAHSIGILIWESIVNGPTKSKFQNQKLGSGYLPILMFEKTESVVWEEGIVSA